LLVSGEILLYGDVGDPWGYGDGFTSTDVAQALSEHGPGDVTVRVNSGGGIALPPIVSTSSPSSMPASTPPRRAKLKADVRGLMKAETGMGADDAVASGFATRKSDEKADHVAQFDYRLYAKAPRDLPGKGGVMFFCPFVPFWFIPFVALDRAIYNTRTAYLNSLPLTAYPGGSRPRRQGGTRSRHDG
jgi:hypothetical protein